MGGNGGREGGREGGKEGARDGGREGEEGGFSGLSSKKGKEKQEKPRKKCNEKKTHKKSKFGGIERTVAREKMMLRCRARGETGRPGRWKVVLIISCMAVVLTGQTLARISTLPGRGTFGFYHTGRGCLHKARSVGGWERTRRDRAGQGRTGQDRAG